MFFVILAWECFCLLIAHCVCFDCNEDNAVKLSAPYITMCDFFFQVLIGSEVLMMFLPVNLCDFFL